MEYNSNLNKPNFTVENHKRNNQDKINAKYSKGRIINNVYYNEWLNIQVSIPDFMENASKSQYINNESDITDCGLFISSKEDYKETVLFKISFTKLSESSNLNTPEKQNENILNAHKRTFALGYPNCSITSSTAQDVIIAEKIFVMNYLLVSGDESPKWHVNTYAFIFSYILDNYVVKISIFCDSIEVKELLINNIKTIPDKLREELINYENDDYKYIIVPDKFGNEVKYKVLFDFHSEENEKDYIVYTDDTCDDSGRTKVYYASYIEDEDGMQIFPVKKRHEIKIIITIINQLQMEAKELLEE